MALALIRFAQKLPKSSSSPPALLQSAPIEISGRRSLGWLLARRLNPGEAGYPKQRRNLAIVNGLGLCAVFYAVWVLLELRMLPPFYSDEGMDEFYRLRAIQETNPDMDRVAEIHKLRRERQQQQQQTVPKSSTPEQSS